VFLGLASAMLLPLLLAVAPANAGAPQLLRIEGSEEGGAPFPPDAGARLSLRPGKRAALAWGRDGHAELPDPANTTFSTRGGRTRVLGLDARTGEILELVGASRFARLRVRELAGVDAAGIAHDAEQDALFVLDRYEQAILRVAPLRGTRQVDVIPLPDGLPPLRGLAFDAATGHLHVLAPATRELIELGPDGALLANRVLPREIGDARAIAFGPSRDTTDDPAATTLFVASETSGGGATAELSLTAAVPAAAPTDGATLLQTVLTSDFDPPSPDPSGLDLINPTENGPLLISDGEVNEMPIFENVNLYDASTAGSLIGTSVTTHFSNEPTGVGIDWSSNRFFFTDDTGTRAVYEVNAGGNQRVDPSDPWREIDLGGLGIVDPEGAAFGGGALFVVDGVNTQVHRIAPGPNGQIDGGGDDVVSQFDTQSLGVVDPEGLAYDFDGGHLYVQGEPDDRIAHVTTDGTLLRWLDTSAATARAPAGLAYGPGPGGTRRLYVVDRGVDNNSDPNENDGKLYIWEVTPLGSGGNLPPSVSVSVPGSTDLGQTASISGSVSDDGLPTPPQLTTTWTQEFGPGIVDFGDETQISTTASFPEPGSYVLPNGPQVFELRITNDSDDAEEEPTGSGVGLGSSDLELVTDGPNVQTVGLRFDGVAVPPGATIVNAWIQFQVDEDTVDPTNLVIRGERVPNATPFLTSNGNISGRADTNAVVNWSPPPWPTRGEQGEAQKTPPLTAIVQEIVGLPGWASGNAMVFTIQGSGERVAEAVDGDPTGAALLHVEYDTGTPPTTTTSTVPTTTTTTSTVPTTTTTTTTTSTVPTTTTTTSTTSTVPTTTTTTSTTSTVPTTTTTTTSTVPTTTSTAPTTSTTTTTTSTVPTTTTTTTTVPTTTTTTTSTVPTTTTTTTTTSTVPTTTTTTTTTSTVPTTTTTTTTSTTTTTLAPVPPTVAIQSPDSGVEVRLGDPITFTGSANDPSEGDLSAGLTWSSSLDGVFGSGASFSYAGLSLGTHVITANVTDAEGATGSDQVTVVIDASGAPPIVSISSPPAGSRFNQSDVISFSATATDPETGDVSATLVWVSQKDGVLGTGPSFSASGLSKGKHNVTVTATDPGGKPGSATTSFHVQR
jgi:hypothetical protein